MDPANEVGFDALASGDFHVGWGSLVVAGVGVALVLGAIGTGTVELLLAGIVLLAVGVGIFVDAWAHGFFH